MPADALSRSTTALDDDALMSGLVVAAHEWMAAGGLPGLDPADIVEVRGLRATPLGAAVSLRRGFPVVVWLLVSIRLRSGAVDVVQLFVALGHEVPERVPDHGVIGPIPGRADGFVAWSALADSTLALTLCRQLAPDLEMTRVVPHVVDRFGTQLLVDAHWVAQFPHRVEDGPHPDVHAAGTLGSDTGPIAPGRGVWRSLGADLGMLRPLRVPTSRGTSVVEQSMQVVTRRDGTGMTTRRDVETFEELGRSVASFHAASARHFGQRPGTAEDLTDLIACRWAIHGDPGAPEDWFTVEQRLRHLGTAEDLGSVIRIHGDLDLDATTRERHHWRLHGLGGTSGGAAARWSRPATPMWDLSVLLRSLEDTASARRGRSTQPELALIIDGWIERCTDALITGYVSVPDAAALLPEDRSSRDALLTLCEVLGRMVEVSRRRVVIDLRDLAFGDAATAGAPRHVAARQ